MDICWRWTHFSELGIHDLYEILQLRQQVFVLEQQCLYQDIDDIDCYAWHLSATQRTGEKTDKLIAYLRVVEPGRKYDEPSNGRVITKESFRGLGIVKSLFIRGVQHTLAEFHNADIRISAQQHLAGFYGDAGFERVGTPYLEDDIPHVEMILRYVQF